MFLSRLLLGVPKWKTPKPKKWTRKFNTSFRLKPIENLVKCSFCGSVHKLTTICLDCYLAIRTRTSEVKQTMMAYNPFLGERQKTYTGDRTVESSIPAESISSASATPNPTNNST